MGTHKAKPYVLETLRLNGRLTAMCSLDVPTSITPSRLTKVKNNLTSDQSHLQEKS